jgi:hypothetical protein
MYLNSLGESKLKRIIYDAETPKSDSAQANRPQARQFIVSLSSSPQTATAAEQEKKNKKAEEDREARRDMEETLTRALEIMESALGPNHIEIAGIILLVFRFNLFCLVCFFFFFLFVFFV